jgi:hypothetical protein
MSSHPTLLIPCGGEGRRWQQYTGVPKPLITIDGETLVRRTARLFRELVPDVDVYLIGTDPRLAFQGIRLVPPDPEGFGSDFDKLACGWSRWSLRARTWIVWADLYLTELAADWMCKPAQPDLVWYGRLGPGRFTGKPYAELWGCSFLPEQHDRLQAAIRACDELLYSGQLPRALAWSVYEMTAGLQVTRTDPPRRQRGHGLVEIDDRTEDFDYPEDLDRWLATRPRGTGVECEHDEQTTGEIARAVPDGTRAEVCDGNESRPANSSRG